MGLGVYRTVYLFIYIMVLPGRSFTFVLLTLFAIIHP